MPINLEKEFELVTMYRENPVAAARDLLGIDLPPHQRLALRAMWASPNTILVMGRGGGKTFIDALFCVLRAMLYPGEKVGIISASFRQCFFVDMDCLPIFTSHGMISSPEEFFGNITPGVTRIDSILEHNLILNKWKTHGDGFMIDLDGGFSIGGLSRHEVLTISNNGELEYKNLDSLDVGGWVVIKAGNGLFGNRDDIHFEYPSKRKVRKFEVMKEMSPDLAYWIGLITGDGCISHRKKQKNKRNKIIFVNSDSDLIRSCSDFSENNFGIKPEIKRQKNNKSLILNFSSVFLAEFMGNLGVSDKLSYEKEIPSSIRKSSRRNVAAFLSAMFDTDGSFSLTKNKGAIIDLSTSSRIMASQIQCFLLQFGIISSITVSSKAGKRFLTGRKKISNCRTGYKVRITSREMSYLFQREIGFRCIRKKKALEQYLSGNFKGRDLIHHIVPNIHVPLLKLLERIKKKTRYGMIEERFLIRHTANNCRRFRPITKDRLVRVLELADRLVPGAIEIISIRTIVDSGFYFRKISKKTPHSGEAIDIEVDKEHCYVAGGVVNHNSKFVFSEVEKMYDMSPDLRAMCTRRPVKMTDMCYLDFISTGNRPGSVIHALPLGDGGKIRGGRYYTVVGDEAAQIPKDILNVVVRGMLATAKNPMEQVRMLEMQAKLIKEGKLNPEDVKRTNHNRIVLSSTAYFQYNHLWARVQNYINLLTEKKKAMEEAIAKGLPITEEMKVYFRGGELNNGQIPFNIMSDHRRALIAFNCEDLPEGFMDQNTIDEARIESPHYEFMMEFFVYFPADSDGFFPRSLIDKAQNHRNYASAFSLPHQSGMVNIMGIDPARNGANFAIVIIQLNIKEKKARLKRMLTYNKQTYPHMHMEIRRLIKEYNIAEIAMDSGGGGTAIRDLLADEESCPLGHDVILQRDFDEHESRKGKRILSLVEFSRYEWLHDANHNLLLAFQNSSLEFPVEKGALISSDSYDETPEEEIAYMEIKQLIEELQNIITKFTPTGRMQWDTAHKKQRKDRYSALLIGYDMANSYLSSLNKPQQLASGFWQKGGRK
jgi:intein/homing endonuclease